MTSQRATHRLRMPAQGIDITVHAGEDEDGALERAVNERPALRERVERSRSQRAAGPTAGVPLEDLLVREGMSTEPQAPRPRKQSHRGPAADPTQSSGKLQLRLPQSLHRDVVRRAEHEGVSVNQLLVAYISRALGQDEGASSSAQA